MTCRWNGGAVVWLLVAVLVASDVREAAAQDAPAPQHQIEAVFLFHFAQFVSWPPQAFPDAGAPLVIGVLGEDPFGTYLDEVVRGETVGGRPLAVRRYRRAEDVDACHILFVGRDEARHLARLLPQLGRRPVLTVGETDDFARRGGMVQFVEERGKIRLRINVEAARTTGLSISSKLLRLADVVTTGRG